MSYSGQQNLISLGTEEQEPFQVRGLQSQMKCVGKIIEWSKKSYLWTFEVKKKSSDVWTPIKVQFLDSLNSGKRTILVNDKIVLEKARMNNFGIEPYLILQEPIKLRLCKLQKTSISKGFDLFIEGELFTNLQAQQGPPQQANKPSLEAQNPQPLKLVDSGWSTNSHHVYHHHSNHLSHQKADEFKFNFQTNANEVEKEKNHVSSEDFFDFGTSKQNQKQDSAIKRSLTMPLHEVNFNDGLQTLEDFFAGGAQPKQKLFEEVNLSREEPEKQKVKDLFSIDLPEPNKEKAKVVDISQTQPSFKPDPFQTNARQQYAASVAYLYPPPPSHHFENPFPYPGAPAPYPNPIHPQAVYAGVPQPPMSTTHIYQHQTFVSNTNQQIQNQHVLRDITNTHVNKQPPAQKALFNDFSQLDQFKLGQQPSAKGKDAQRLGDNSIRGFVNFQ